MSKWMVGADGDGGMYVGEASDRDIELGSLLYGSEVEALEEGIEIGLDNRRAINNSVKHFRQRLRTLKRRKPKP